jgi:dienelactone hydrolase
VTLTDDLRRRFEIGAHPLRPTGARRADRDGLRIEELVFATAGGETVRGVLAGPPGRTLPGPAILCIHAHGNRYDIGADELLAGRPALHSAPGPAFARAGFVTLMIDLPGFGSRQLPGEGARAKAALWQGGSLAGQMLGELASAIGWLGARREIDPARIGVYGLSMGATLGYWLAACEPRVAAVAQLCCYADFAALVATGAHDLHAIYLAVPGLLALASNGRIAGLVAPRPQFIGIGDGDPLTPPEAVDLALAETRAAYAALEAPGRLVLHREAGSGHRETAAMRGAVLGFFARYLAGS